MRTFWVRPVAVAKAWVIGRDKVIAIRKPSEERLEHPRRRREPVQEENRRSIFRAGLPVKDGEAIDLHSAINSRVFHGTFLSLAVGWQRKGYKHRRGRQPRAEDTQAADPVGRAQNAHSHSSILNTF